MIKLNLLPPEEKNWLRLNQIQRWIIFYGSAILSSFIIFVALLTVIWLSLSIQLKNTSTNFSAIQQGLPGQSIKTQQNLIDELNAELNRISQLEKNRQDYSKILISLAGMMPAGTRLEELTIGEQNKITIAGHAQAREQVINLKNSLTDSPLFTDVASPLDNLVKQTDINFSFSATIKSFTQ